MSYTVKKSSDRTLREISQFGVRSSNIAPKAVESEHIGEQVVQTQHIQDKAITGVKIAEASIDEAHIKDAAITSAKIGDLSADKIKAGTLTVSDQVGYGAAAISVQSEGYEKVRLDSDGILVNDGYITVRNNSGATVISPQGVNVETTDIPLSQSYNYLRNAFFKVLTKGGSEDIDDIGNRAYKWKLEKTGALPIYYGLTAHNTAMDYGISFGTNNYNGDIGTITIWQGVMLEWLNKSRPHTVSIRHDIRQTSTEDKVELVVEVTGYGPDPVYTSSKRLEPFDEDVDELLKITSITIPPFKDIPGAKSNIGVKIVISKKSTYSKFYGTITGAVLEQGTRPSENAYNHIHEFIGEYDVIPDLLIPPGAIMPFARPSVPAGWLPCEGQEVSRRIYDNLFSAIGTTFGAGDGSTTFNLPDLRGEFIRGWDNGRGVDPGRQFGSWQADEFRQHNHYSDIRFNKLSARASDLNNAGTTTDTDSGGATNEYRIGQMSDYWDAATLKDTGGPETRPRNVALLYCIKY